jgi:prepilin-type N-terminal cleavage/methylation domain-containing protein
MQANRDTVSYSKLVWSKRAFTLIELMIVVAIIAIISAAVVPSFTMSLQKNRQREAAMLIIQGVFGARSRAARTGRCHRVRIYLSESQINGGFGGAVAIDEYDQAECSRNGGAWNRLSYKSIAQGTDPQNGDEHAGLVGNDIAISRVLDSTGSPSAGGNEIIIRFEPSGGIYIRDADELFFEVQAYSSDGQPMGVARHVRLAPSGAVRYLIFSEFRAG